jgi:hypothetical protein
VLFCNWFTCYAGLLFASSPTPSLQLNFWMKLLELSRIFWKVQGMFYYFYSGGNPTKCKRWLYWTILIFFVILLNVISPPRFFTWCTHGLRILSVCLQEVKSITLNDSLVIPCAHMWALYLVVVHEILPMLLLCYLSETLSSLHSFGVVRIVHSSSMIKLM